MKAPEREAVGRMMSRPDIFPKPRPKTSLSAKKMLIISINTARFILQAKGVQRSAARTHDGWDIDAPRLAGGKVAS